MVEERMILPSAVGAGITIGWKIKVTENGIQEKGDKELEEWNNMGEKTVIM
jgi:hypothetical protein